MDEEFSLYIEDRWISDQRSVKNPVNPWRPYSYFVEKERTAEGRIVNVAAIFLTNHECPFKCLICDLWKNTTNHPVPETAIPTQIQWALDRLPEVTNVKLYNNGNFFDEKAIPPQDLPTIAKLLNPYKQVILECHPNFINKRCLTFKDLLKPGLQIGMGLETIHPEMLPRLNKNMTIKDFKYASHYLAENSISSRAFILLSLPFLKESESIIWAKRSIYFAFDAGVECCVIIPTRSGNGALEHLEKHGLFSPPRIESLEEVFEYGLQLKAGRMFADLWDISNFSSRKKCRAQRVKRMRVMNLTQSIPSPIK